MPINQIAELTKELQQFQTEKENIRNLVGQIGGMGFMHRERLVTWLFMGVLILLFAADVSRHIFGIATSLPPLFSIEIGVLLVSFKIIWMIHNQTRVEHFQFWILTSIEFRVDQISNRLRAIEKQVLQTQSVKPNDQEQQQDPCDAEPETSKS